MSKRCRNFSKIPEQESRTINLALRLCWMSGCLDVANILNELNTGGICVHMDELEFPALSAGKFPVPGYFQSQDITDECCFCKLGA